MNQVHINQKKETVDPVDYARTQDRNGFIISLIVFPLVGMFLYQYRPQFEQLSPKVPDMVFYVYGSISLALVNLSLQFLCCLVVNQSLVGLRSCFFCLTGIFSMVLTVTGFEVLWSKEYQSVVKGNKQFEDFDTTFTFIVWSPVIIVLGILAFVCLMICCIGALAATGTEVSQFNNTETGRNINKTIR